MSDARAASIATITKAPANVNRRTFTGPSSFRSSSLVLGDHELNHVARLFRVAVEREPLVVLRRPRPERGHFHRFPEEERILDPDASVQTVAFAPVPLRHLLQRGRGQARQIIEAVDIEYEMG